VERLRNLWGVFQVTEETPIEEIPMFIQGNQGVEANPQIRHLGPILVLPSAQSKMFLPQRPQESFHSLINNK
jgi:hypothetical protein